MALRNTVNRQSHVSASAGERYTVRRANKHIKVSGRMCFTWFMLGGLILLFAPQRITDKFQLAFAHIFRWPLNIGRSVSLSVQTPQAFTEVVSRTKYNQLESHLANIVAQRDQARETVEKLSGLRPRFPLDYAQLVYAQIIRDTIGGTQNSFVIDRGELDGVRLGQLVLANNSIVGKISEIYRPTATVKLLTDPSSRLPVLVKTGEHSLESIMEGLGNNSARVKLIPVKKELKVGQAVYINMPGSLDSPMIVGKISKCIRDSEDPLLWDITVEPACDVAALKDVVVIIMNPEQ